ncbi:MAG TPA: hypothetical protein VI168_04695 [Croceibacterium sp.]
MLAATISAGVVSTPVRICSLTEESATLDGPTLPAVGTGLMLRRLNMSIFATVTWNDGGRCGLRLSRRISVEEWEAGGDATADSARLGQSRVDQLLAAIRSGTDLPAETETPAPRPADAPPLKHTIAAELARVKRMLDQVSEELTDDVEVLMRHERAMQNFDIAAMIVAELATVMAAADRRKALDAVQMHDLRSRLSGRPTLT